MKSKPRIQRIVIATLMMFAIVVIGLQPFAFVSGAGCACNATASVTAAQPGDELSCCNSLKHKQAQTDCCSFKPAPATGCCCNPTASVCQCDGCGCSEDDNKNPPSPAIPAKKTTEVVTPVLMFAAPLVGYRGDREVQRVDYQNTAAEFAALTSQETCVLLSRFTC